MFYSDDPARDWDRYCDYLDRQQKAWLEEIDGQYVSNTQSFELKFIKNSNDTNLFDVFIYDKKYLEVSINHLNESLEEFEFVTSESEIIVNLDDVYFSYKINVISDEEFEADDIDEIYSEGSIIINKTYELPEYDSDAKIGLALFEKICMDAISEYIYQDYDEIYSDAERRF